VTLLEAQTPLFSRPLRGTLGARDSLPPLPPPFCLPAPQSFREAPASQENQASLSADHHLLSSPPFTSASAAPTLPPKGREGSHPLEAVADPVQRLQRLLALWAADLVVLIRRGRLRGPRRAVAHGRGAVGVSRRGLGRGGACVRGACSRWVGVGACGAGGCRSRARRRGWTVTRGWWWWWRRRRQGFFCWRCPIAGETCRLGRVAHGCGGRVDERVWAWGVFEGAALGAALAWLFRGRRRYMKV
jgi:hypothetical protein